MIAKNIGIRRASGKFILATNIDVIINQKLYEFISQKKLEEKKIYRILIVIVSNIIILEILKITISINLPILSTKNIIH